MTVKDVLFSQFGWWIQALLTAIMFILALYSIYQLYIKKKPAIKKINIDVILIIGAAVAVLGITLQIIGFVMALEVILEAGDISPQMVMGGFKISFYTTIYGFITFLVSCLLWYIAKIKWELNKKQIS